MICPHIVNVSVLLGGILSWGIMWPLIRNKKGSWYAASLSETSLHGLQGYRVSKHSKKKNPPFCCYTAIVDSYQAANVVFLTTAGVHIHCLDSWRRPVQLREGAHPHNRWLRRDDEEEQHASGLQQWQPDGGH